jgi:hypothetical protein
VFDLNGGGINLTAMSNASPMLDMQGNGFAVHTGWVQPNDGVLVLEHVPDWGSLASAEGCWDRSVGLCSA